MWISVIFSMKQPFILFNASKVMFVFVRVQINEISDYPRVYCIRSYIPHQLKFVHSDSASLSH